MISQEAYLKWKSERARRKLTPGERFGRAKFIFAWIFALAVFVVCMLVLMVYAMTFGEKKTQSFLLSIALALFTSFVIIEPIEILLLVSLPFLLDNGWTAQLRSRAKDLGLI
eukprot:scaffold149838_cov43-Tisochrysis_lutea.AAC.1